MLKQSLIGAGLLPSRFMWPNPFKIIEYEELLRGVDVRPTDAILDLGCGAGPQDLLLASAAARVVGIDVSEAQIARAQALAATYARGRNLEYRCTPLESAGFARHEFDKVVSFSVLEHIGNREQVLRVIADVLKPGGMLLMSVDSLATITDLALIRRHRSDHAVLTYFTIPELRSMLQLHGFTEIHVRPIFRGPYAKRLFESGIEGEFRYHRYRKFGALARLKLDEYLHRDAEQGMFLCATGIKPQ